MDLPKIGGQFRLLISTTRNVGVRRDDFPPGLQPANRCRLDQGTTGLSLLASHLFVEDLAAQFQLQTANRLRLWRRDRGQEAFRRIERPVGVVAGEVLLVRPAITNRAQLGDQ